VKGEVILRIAPSLKKRKEKSKKPSFKRNTGSLNAAKKKKGGKKKPCRRHLRRKAKKEGSNSSASKSSVLPQRLIRGRKKKVEGIERGLKPSGKDDPEGGEKVRCQFLRTRDNGVVGEGERKEKGR